MRITFFDYLRTSFRKKFTFCNLNFCSSSPQLWCILPKLFTSQFLIQFSLHIHTNVCVCLKLNKFSTFSILFHFAFEANWELSSLIWNLLWITALDVLSKINIVYSASVPGAVMQLSILVQLEHTVIGSGIPVIFIFITSKEIRTENCFKLVFWLHCAV